MTRKTIRFSGAPSRASERINTMWKFALTLITAVLLGATCSGCGGDPAPPEKLTAADEAKLQAETDQVLAEEAQHHQEQQKSK